MKKRLIRWILKSVDWKDVGRIVVNFLLERLKKSDDLEEKRRWVRKFLAINEVFKTVAVAIQDFNVDKDEFMAIEAAIEEVAEK